MMIGELFPLWGNRVAVLIYCSVDIMAFINDDPPPATVILISGDRDFAYLLSTVRWRKHNVVLISNSSMTHKSLTAQASVAYDWKHDILNAQPPPKSLLFRSHTLSSVAASTTPQESENPPESDVHAVDPARERVTPAIQSFTLFPRPASTTTIGKARPRRSTLPTDAPSVDQEAIRTPPKTGTPSKTAPATVLSNPTSDDRIEANLVGGSIVVISRSLIPSLLTSYFNRILSRSNQLIRLMKVV